MLDEAEVDALAANAAREVPETVPGVLCGEAVNRGGEAISRAQAKTANASSAARCIFAIGGSMVIGNLDSNLRNFGPESSLILASYYVGRHPRLLKISLRVHVLRRTLGVTSTCTCPCGASWQDDSLCVT